MGLKLAVLCSQGGGRATTMGLRLAVLCSQGGGSHYNGPKASSTVLTGRW